MLIRTMTSMALCGILALALFVPTASAQTASTPWAGPKLEPKGWTFVQNDNQVALFYKFPAMEPKGVMPQLWSRYEYKAAQNSGVSDLIAFRSALQLYEYDCAQGRSRFLESIIYEGNNLEGTTSSRSDAGPWEYSAPGTFGEMGQKIICGTH